MPMAEATVITPRFSDAVETARRIHAGDLRKGTGIPYLAHLLSVAALVLEHGGTEDEAIAALLHDTAEDHGGQRTIDTLRAEYGDQVADIVEACSDTLVTDRTQKEPWWDRKVRYLERLAEEPRSALLVSAADKLHNARAVLGDYRVHGDALWERFNADAGRAGVVWYYTRLREVILARLHGTPAQPLADELGFVVGELYVEAERRGHDVDADVDHGRSTEARIRDARRAR
jgi:(p)ppGpp synthase/HD superfamily hydrolase